MFIGPIEGTDIENDAAPVVKSTCPVPWTATEPFAVPRTVSSSDIEAVLAATVLW